MLSFPVLTGLDAYLPYTGIVSEQILIKRRRELDVSKTPALFDSLVLTLTLIYKLLGSCCSELVLLFDGRCCTGTEAQDPVGFPYIPSCCEQRHKWIMTCFCAKKENKSTRTAQKHRTALVPWVRVLNSQENMFENVCVNGWSTWSAALMWPSSPCFFRECQLRSDCGSWSGPSGQPGPRQRSARWSRKSAPPFARPLERKTTHTGAEMWQSFCICTCWDTRLTLARYVWIETEPEAVRVVAGCDPGDCFPVGVPEVDRLSEVYWQTNRLFGSYVAAGWKARCPPTNDKLH